MSRIYLILLGCVFAFASFGQVSDDFSDGDFTVNPTWSGSNALFVDTLGMLRSNSTGAATYYLSTPSTLSSSAQWEFYFNFKFGTSGANFCDAYLMSDNSDLSIAQNGYFVRIGGTTDEISLYSIVSGTETILIDGVDGLINSSSANPFKVRVTRNSADVWTLEYDDGALGTYTLDGTVTDNSINSSSHFGFLITQSSAASPIKGHFFDDVNVQAMASDTTAPQLSAISVLSSTQIDVDFNESIDQTTAETASNYSVNGGIGVPTTATLDGNGYTVHLTFSTSFTNGNTYLLTASNVDDISANTMILDTLSFLYYIVSYKDILFTEIHPAPSTLAEFIELYNNSSSSIDLNGFQFTDASSTVSTFGAYTLPSNSYVTVCSNSDTALFTSFGAVLGVSSFPTLNNGGDDLLLMNATGDTIDFVSYLSSWYGGTSSSGVSLELINPSDTCGSSLNWGPSTDASGHTASQQNSIYSNVADTTAPSVSVYTVLGDSAILITFSEPIDTAALTLGNFSLTPNSIIGFEITSSQEIILTFGTPLQVSTNYQLLLTNIEDCYGNTLPLTLNFTYSNPSYRDVIFTEIHPDPDVVTTVPAVEFVEIYNRTTGDIDLSGYYFSDASSNSGAISNFILGSNSYVTICSTGDISLFTAFGDVIGVSSFPSLNNTGDDLTLYSASGSIMDEVNYLDDWYNGFSTDGVSLEIINPDHPCSLSANWAASTDMSGGTPSQQNSVYNITPDTEAPSILSYQLLGDTSISIVFTEPLDTSTIQLADFVLNTNSVSSFTIAGSSDELVLNFNATLQVNVMHQLLISGISDCIGNAMTLDTVEFGLGISPVEFSVLIDEIFADETPQVSLPTAEFIELYNTSPTDIISLNGCYFTDFNDTLYLNDVNILPNAYLILSSSYSYYDYGDAYVSSSMPGINNTGEQLALISGTGEIIHTVTFSDDWYNDADKDNGGWSLEMVDPSNPCSEDDNWAVSVDPNGGTPGKINSVNASNPDLDGPVIDRAVAVNDSTVFVYFSEILDAGTVVETSFSVDNQQTIKSVELQTDKKTVVLRLTSKLQVKVVYTVVVVDISDCVGNLIDQSGSSTEFALPEAPVIGDIIINEILFNPYSGGNDFVELYNNSNKYIDLKKVYLLDFDSDSIKDLKDITSDYYVVAPSSYVWLTEDFNKVYDFYLKAVQDNYILTDLPTYSNAEGTVAIGFYDDDSLVVADKFDYLDDYHYALLDDEKGVSLERVTFSGVTNDADNWHSASSTEDYATPGYQNSQQLNIEGIDDQITIFPQVFTPDNDGYKDFTSINFSFDDNGYTINITLFDSHGRLIKNLVQNELVGREGFYQWDGIDNQGQKAPVGYYIVFVEVFDLEGNMNQFKKKLVVGARF